MAESSFLLPDLESEDAAPFWRGTARGELLMQQCSDCGRWRMPPRPMCPGCRSLRHDWQAMSGRATVWSYVVAHPPLLPAYAELAPYNAIVVALEEDPGLRLCGNLVATAEGPINEVDPSTIRIDEPVTVVFQKVEDVFLPRWMRRIPS